MPSFLFNVAKGERPLAAPTIMDFPDLRRARSEAAHLLSDEIKTDSDRFWTDREWFIEVTDERGRLLFSISTTTVSAPSTKQRDDPL